MLFQKLLVAVGEIDLPRADAGGIAPCGGWQNYDSDLPRYPGTKAEDCLTTLSVDPINRNICLVRVGSNITNTMVDRTFIAIPY